MNMRIRFSPLALVIATLSGIAGMAGMAGTQQAVEIATRFETEKIAAIENYISENPEADDLDEAYSILAGAYGALGQIEAIPDILDKRYAIIEKGANAPLGTLVGEIGRPYIEICCQIGDKERGKKFVAQLKADLEDHPEAENIMGFIDQIAADLYVPGIGDEMDLKFVATNGEEVDVAAMRGKVILVDFWATWCGPCIQEMPNVIAAYEAYHESGFEVIGISLDDDLGELEQFIAANNMPWPQYFDGKSWGNELAASYGIKGIPSTFLIGKEGKIVATNLRGDELNSAVKNELGL